MQGRVTAIGLVSGLLRVTLMNFSPGTGPKGSMKATVLTTRLFALLALVVLSTACFNRDRQPVYVDSDEVEPIRAPEGLSQPRVRTNFDVPGYFLPQLAAVGDEARPPRVLTSAEAEASRSYIRFGPTGLHLLVEDDPDSVWRRLGFSLNRGGMSVRDVNESDRVFRFHFEHDPVEVQRRGLFARMAFWRGTEVMDFRGIYQARVEGDGDRTRVALLDERGDVVEMDRAEYVLSILRERLG